MLDRLKLWARRIRTDVLALYVAARDPRTPWYAKAAALIVAGYALSPIDLIPDFIPILGYLDDLIILPLGIRLVVRLTPSDLMAEYRSAAATMTTTRVSRTAGVIIVLIWTIAILLAAWFVLRWYSSNEAE